jgi:hypothetical protein
VLSNKRNFLKLFRGEGTERIPWIADLTYWRDAHIVQGTLPPQYSGLDGFLRLHIDLGVMPYYIYSIDDPEGTESKEEISVHQIGSFGRPYNGVFGLRYEGADIEREVSGNTIATVIHVTGYTLIQKKVYLKDSFCHAFQEYPVKDIDSLKILRKVIERYDFFPTYEDYLLLSSAWGEYGLPIAPLPRSPLSALIVDWMGLESFVFAHADYPDEIRKTLDCIARANDSAFDIIVRSPAEIFHFCDNLSASNHASYFRKDAFEYYRKRFEELHSHGKKAAVHLDGTIRGLLGQIAETGADAVEALTPKPAGDLDIGELWDEAGQRDVILWGGLPGVMFTHQFTLQDIYRQVRRLVLELKKDGPVIAGSADQIPPDGDLEYVKYVADLLSTEELFIES